MRNFFKNVKAKVISAAASVKRNVNSGNDEVKNQVKRYIGKYLLDKRISVA